MSKNSTIVGDSVYKIDVETRPEGTLVLRSLVPMGAIETSICNYLQKWAEQAPDRCFLAQRGEDGEWRTIDYQLMWSRVRSVGQALLDLGLSNGSKVAILSGNSIEHAIAAFAAMSVGLIASPISPNYSLLDSGLERLQEIVNALQPSLVFVQDAKAFARARRVAELDKIDWLSAIRCPETIFLDDLYKTEPTDGFSRAFAALDPEAPAKVLFRFGSTSSPKGVINTNRMMASAVAMGANLSSAAEPPLQLDWLPWHHTMGGKERRYTLN